MDFSYDPPPPHWKFQLSFIHFLKVFDLWDPPRNFQSLLWGGVWTFSGTTQLTMWYKNKQERDAEADPGKGLRGLQPPLWAAFFLCYFVWFFLKIRNNINKINSRLYHAFVTLLKSRECCKGVLGGKMGNIIFWGRGMALDPLRACARGTGP